LELANNLTAVQHVTLLSILLMAKQVADLVALVLVGRLAISYGMSYRRTCGFLSPKRQVCALYE